MICRSGKQNFGWSLVSSLLIAFSVSGGIFYGLLRAPLCWQCLSSTEVKESSTFEVVGTGLKLLGNHWFCYHCNREWNPGSPWKENINPNSNIDIGAGQPCPSSGTVESIPEPPDNLEVGEIWYPLKN